MGKYTKVGTLQVDNELLNLINQEIIPNTNVEVVQFWKKFEDIITDLSPINKALLEKRDELQLKMDAWYKDNIYNENDLREYKSFLKEIGYLVEEKKDFKIATENVDEEVSLQAGPQLVVPVKNARFALNAANARWGSLYDALYGTNAIAEEDGLQITKEYNKKRGEAVITYAKEYLDEIFPLKNASHKNVSSYTIVEGKLQVTLDKGLATSLEDESKCIGFTGDKLNPKSIVLKNNNLHVEVLLDKNNFIGAEDKAGVADIIVEAAVTTIMDCEDSVAAVDAQDKVEVYRNWFGLMKGDLKETFLKDDKTITRKLNEDRVYTTLDDKKLVLHGRSLLFIRNVGHLMTSPAILDKDGNEVYEGIMDSMITVLAALTDINSTNIKSNSKTKSVYIVKPKMHGPDEVSYAVNVFERVEEALSLPKNTIKIGIMDEERRTTINLKECIREAKERVVFINTGFLDRTGDEIHTSMLAGAFVPKTDMKQQTWIKAYEDWNVDIGLKCGLQQKAQIGKGMWAMPDEMAAMLDQKIAHPKSGANTAWVPSPTGAVLHSIHYHKVNVLAIQEELKNKSRASLDDLLTLPLLKDTLNKEQIKLELDNNCQGLLGYVVRWIDAGIGCSKVPDINNIGLMEDRATLRISSQHIANWLEHGICTKEQVMDSLKAMAVVVDKQNKKDATYNPIAPTFDGIAFKAACDLIFKGKEQPAGYTEPILHEYRRKYKNINE
ncbi:malate synthase G [Sulfurospirillum arcachonense]|uniref:malate synthase G n=1 Tax=Sulfurospirillum arcachonense TaxID=57666 RepID=UPI0004692471|nr:malate synthase G [Sulfurospirillum arcachonense]